MAQLTAYEQYLLELVNRARSNPLAEASLFGIGLNDGLSANTISESAKQPLAFNFLLIDAARFHSQWMLDRDIFSHTGIDGSSPGDRMKDAGYNFTGGWTWSENISYWGTTGILNPNLAVDKNHEGLFKSSGHRRNILNEDFREVGFATITGDFEGYNVQMVTENFAKSGSDVFLTGVAYDDSILDDDFYTIGEGLGEIEVTATRQSDNSSFTTTTMAAGGYQIALDPGTYQVSFAKNGQTIRDTSQIVIGDRNVKLDLNIEYLNTTQHIGEIGRFSSLNHLEQTIQFNNTYTNPVVFALPLSYNGGDPAIGRITNIQSNSFSVYVQEPEYLDKRHNKESFSYIVLEAGTWQLADGTSL